MKKGFTLIELLAVIVILAIIALIATPIVLNIIEDAKANTTMRSAENYLKAVELSIAKSVIKTDGTLDGIYLVNKKGNLCKEEDGISCKNDLKIEVDNEKPDAGSKVEIKNGKINYESTILKSNNYSCFKENSFKCLKGNVLFLSTLDRNLKFETEKDLYDYKIYGNSVQNGTPTLEVPIQIESVGDKTKNILA